MFTNEDKEAETGGASVHKEVREYSSSFVAEILFAPSGDFHNSVDDFIDSH
jgi:hypothetical protein